MIPRHADASLVQTNGAQREVGGRTRTHAQQGEYWELSVAFDNLKKIVAEFIDLATFY